MDFAVENKSPTKELEETAENELKDKTQCLQETADDESKGQDQIEEKTKDEENMLQPEHNENTENIENNCEILLSSESSVEAQKEIPSSVSKNIVNENKDDVKDSEERSDDLSNLNQDPENMAVEEIKESKSKRPSEEECNNQDTLNQGAQEVDADNADDGNQTSVQDTDQAASTSTQVQFREKCKYGSQCYRLNAEHKTTFSHPGDTDYDDPDNRPECPYGVQCYRKNPQHKLDYKHTGTKRKRTQNTVQTVSLDDLSDFEDSFEESVDESEYDGSFIDDDDELDDDFESDFDSDESDQENKDDDDSEDKDGNKKKKKKVKKKTDGKKRKKAKTD